MPESISQEELENARDHWAGSDDLTPRIAAELLAYRELLLVWESRYNDAVFGRDRAEKRVRELTDTIERLQRQRTASLQDKKVLDAEVASNMRLTTKVQELEGELAVCVRVHKQALERQLNAEAAANAARNVVEAVQEQRDTINKRMQNVHEKIKKLRVKGELSSDAFHKIRVAISGDPISEEGEAWVETKTHAYDAEKAQDDHRWANQNRPVLSTHDRVRVSYEAFYHHPTNWSGGFPPLPQMHVIGNGPNESSWEHYLPPDATVERIEGGNG